jgi:uncharacterized protein (DUF58 family)
MEPGEYKAFRQSRLQLFSRIKLRNIFPGEWESIYTGGGIEFVDTQPFEPGDDLKDLDLITFVQSGEEEIVRRAAGRQMRVFVFADLSGSMLRSDEMFLSSKPEIRDIATGLIVYSANNAYSPVGLCAFDSEVRCFLPAKYGETNCQKILGKIIDSDYTTTPASSDIPKAVSFLIQRVRDQSMVFWVSDFKDRVFEGDFTELFRPVVKRVDLVPVVIMDPIEKQLVLKRPINMGVVDNEGEGRTEIYLTPKRLRNIQDLSTRHLKHLEDCFRRLDIRHIVLDSPSLNDCFQVLSGYFETRKRTRV